MAEKKTDEPDEVTEEHDSEKIGEHETYHCPSCNGEVADDATKCPSCGVEFENGNGSAPSETEETETPSSPSEEEVPASTSLDDEKESPSLPTESDEDMPSQDQGEEDIHEETPEPAVPPAEEPPPHIVSDNDLRMINAIREYSDKRRKRYMNGALSTGLGILCFVLLWLVTVYQVMVEETETMFGLEVVLLLVIASVFFILGLYLILTYPKSSLLDVFGSIPRGESPGDIYSD